MTYSAIAKKIGSSAAYITKIFRGDSNMTIETMVKLARATGGQLEIKVIDAATASVQWDLSRVQANDHRTTRITQSSATIIEFPKAANSDEYHWKNAA